MKPTAKNQRDLHRCNTAINRLIKRRRRGLPHSKIVIARVTRLLTIKARLHGERGQDAIHKQIICHKKTLGWRVPNRWDAIYLKALYREGLKLKEKTGATL